VKVDDRPHDVPEDEGNPVIVAGFGRFGQIVVRLLYANRIGVTVLDHDPEIIDTLRKFDFKVFYGDATRLDLLEAAGAAKAKVLVVAVDTQEASLQLVDLAQQHFPNLKIVARARDLPHAMELMNRKVPVVERETFHSALHLGEETLKALGQTAYAARQRALMFRQHNLALLDQLHAHWDDDIDKRITLQRQARARLQQNLEADEKSQQAARGLGWD
ncbi:MAG: NAD-binding protein, partial [Ferrovibrio sp.]